MKTKYLAIATVAFMLALTGACMVSDGSDATATPSGDVDWSVPLVFNINAAETKTATISVYNLVSNPVHIMLSVKQIEYATITISDTDFVLKSHGTSGDRAFITVTVESDRFANHTDSNIEFTLTSYNPMNGTTESSVLTSHAVINSKYAADSTIGKILGRFENTLPEPFDSIISSAVITFAIWIIISVICSSLVRIAMQHTVALIDRHNVKKSEINTGVFKKTWKYIFGIVIMYGISNTMLVLGTDEYYIGTFTDVTNIITILFIGMTLWHMYTALAHVLSNILTSGDEESSLKPLILLLGRILIVILTILAIMHNQGIEMSSLALAFTFAATGISFGAKTLITQFFCGIQIMILRTFRSGDKIRVGADNTTLVVKNVGIMTTRCKNWSNEEIYYVPNSTLADAKIVNITKNNVFYKVYDYYTIAHDADIALARSIMVDVAMSDPGTLFDDTFPKPDVRFNEVNLNEVSLRLAYTVVNHEDYGSISARIRENIFKRFIQEGIDIPYPQYTVNIVGSESKKDDDRDEWE